MEHAPLVNDDDEPNDCLSSDEFELKPRTNYRITNESKFKSKMGISCSSILSLCRNKAHKTQPRNVMIGRRDLNSIWYPKNVIRNQKYNILTFIPLVLFEQFRFFLNLYFLVMACTQFISVFRVGYLYTYWGPLAFVLFVTMLREAYDDIKRAYRDKELNSQIYTLLGTNGRKKKVPSSQLQVSDVIIIQKNQRIPADVVLLQTSDKSGTCFIRTDQLDGETDWKLRIAAPLTQSLEDISVLISEASATAKIHAEPPSLSIHEFNGVISWKEDEPLTVENVLWSGTVLATGEAVCCVIYTGSDTRMVMNTSKPRSKVGLLDNEINTLTKLLFAALVILSIVMLVLKGFRGPWYRYMVRFFLLFSYMIPISLRVNLDMGKTVYAWFIQRDKTIPGTVVRTSTIPEELGRVGYLLSDKTGTLTQNFMIFKRIHLGTVSYTNENQTEISNLLKQQFRTTTTPIHENQQSIASAMPSGKTRNVVKKTEATKVPEAVKALALCHNVTPVFEEKTSTSLDTSARSADDRNANITNVPRTSITGRGGDISSLPDTPLTGVTSINTTDGSDLAQLLPTTDVTYQASSPDEVALVTWTEQVGLTLVHRDLQSMTLQLNSTQHLFHYQILQTFPFTSETKRMGIIIRDEQTNEIIFYLKGADIVMQSIVQYNDWLQEECSNMAREGLRTLVVAKKHLTTEQYQEFEQRLMRARLQTIDRNRRVNEVIETLERDMELLCVTGVEDKLQENVRQTLETLRNAGIKIWMLTGDKLETATCIAKSSKLIGRDHDIYTFKQVTTRDECLHELNMFRRKTDACLIITGDTLQICLSFYEKDLMELTIQCPAVVVCRCSPTQKANVVELLKKYGSHRVRVCAIGDGGNDVSMIQSADVGVGIVGKEGKQASLAADFSINQFSYLSRLLLVHGRNSYKRSAALSQFVMHRGLIISVMQAIFSSIFYFASISLYQGFLLVGYGTVYTMFPVFSLVLDKDVRSEIALLYPELYKELSKGRSLSFKTFFLWVFISIYQGGAIMYGSFLLFDDDFIHVVSITFTSLILTELLMVALTIRTWHPLMILAQLLSLACYVLSLIVLKSHFDPEFLQSWDFIWRVLLVTLISCLPLYILKFVQVKCKPPIQQKLMQYATLK
jgi:phospholipid-translocating ATPase